MDFDAYRREILSIEAPPSLAEETAERIMEEGHAGDCHATSLCVSDGKAFSVGRFRRGRLRVAACAAACLMLSVALTASMASFFDLGSAGARAPKTARRM